MPEGISPVICRHNYVEPAFWIRQVDLVFDLDPVKTLVINQMFIEPNPAQARRALRLHGEGIHLTRLLINGESISFHREDGAVVIDTPPEGPFTLEVRNTCSPEKNSQLSGLYTSGGGLFTQCEAEGFRRITYFLDRPDVMAVFTVTLRGPKSIYPVLLSNGNLLEQGDLDKGHHYAKWHDPFPKPCYLFALVAADLVVREQHIRSRSGKNHLLQIYVRRGDLDKTEHAMNSLIASIVWDEARFGLALDLDRFMIVAVSDFNMGAMENKGLNIFNTKFVLASPFTATDADYAGIESVVGHEYFHNWTGNRITCRDWFQLSLKEGLTVFRDQEFSMDMAHSPSARAVRRIEDVRQLRHLQFPEDAGPMSHPVRPDEYLEINNFYTSTIYEKGAEVVRMMQTLVGRDGFAQGMKLYFKRHDGQAVTCDDFAQAIADANPGTELAQHLEAFKRWYSQAGTPEIHAKGRYDAPSRTYTLLIEQNGVASSIEAKNAYQPFVIPVSMGLIGRSGQALPLRLETDSDDEPCDHRVLVVTEKRNFFTFINVDEEPVPSLLRGFSAPVILFDGLGDAELLLLLRHDNDPFNRWEAGQRLALNRLLAALRKESCSTLMLDGPFIEAMRELLTHPGIDAAFKELILTPPGEGYIAEQLEVVNPRHIHTLRESLRLQLAQALRHEWQIAFEKHQTQGAYSPDPISCGKRALANLSLSMLCLDATARGDLTWPGRALQRFKDAHNMTDRLGALQALLACRSPLADQALDRFYTLFVSEPLVIDKWFAIQATAPESDGEGLARVQALLKHPDFSLKNPNRARSLIASFCMSNPAAFHRSDGAGYEFWADSVLELDASNPQLAARIARIMDRWTRLASPFREAAQQALHRVAAKASLSKDVKEIISHALWGESALS